MQPTDRLHALDAVRAYALLLGVVLHSIAGFLQDFPIAAWVDTPSTTAAVIYYVIHIFRMSAFFLMAGFFARMVVERRGMKAFVKDRAKRIAIPLFLFGPVTLILISVGFVLERWCMAWATRKRSAPRCRRRNEATAQGNPSTTSSRISGFFITCSSSTRWRSACAHSCAPSTRAHRSQASAIASSHSS